MPIGSPISITLTKEQRERIATVPDKVDKETGKSLVANTEIAKIHDQNTDTSLDHGGANAVTAADAADAVTKKHAQNTDTGTTSETFQVDSGNTGPKLKNIAGTMAVRNDADDADAPIRVSEVLVDDPVEATGEYTIWEVPGALGEVFAKCTVECTNVDGGTQESVIHFYRMIAGTLTKVLTIDNTPE